MEHMAYFDNAATTYPKPESVYDFTDSFYRTFGVNVGRGQHKLAARASFLVQETRELLLELFHCPSKKVVFTHTATEALNLLLRGLPITDNYTIYISPFEHNAVTRVLAYLKSIYNLNIEMLSVDKKTMQFDIAKIRSQFTIKKPNWMIISHASNVCGVVAPIEQLCELSKEFGAINIIDMCQTAGLIDVDLSSDNFDFAVFDGHKTLYSPLGIAGIISDFKIKPSPLIYGGTGIDSANQSLPDSIPERYEVASANIMAIGGLNSALKWIKNTGIHTLYDKEKENHKRLLTILSSHSNIKIIANNTDRVSNAIGVVSCVFDGYSSDNIGKILSDNDVAVRSGLHCAPFAHKFLDTFPFGTVRFSVSYFNSDEDFKLLQTALDYIEENS